MAINSLPILCNDPTPPPGMFCRTTPIYGAPRGTTGRNNTPISGIAVHGLRDSFDGYLSKACAGLTRLSVNCKASMHYVIDGQTGAVSSLVREEDLAWAFQSYRSNFPVTSPLDGCPCPEPCPTPPCPTPLEPQTYPGWTVLSNQFPNLAADFYTINIGITTPNRPEQSALDGADCCQDLPYGISQEAYDSLIRLIAWIAFRNPGVIIDDQHIQFHDYIVFKDTMCLEFPCGPNGVCLICDVSRYCERCTDVIDPTYVWTDNPDDILFLLGESRGGCKIRFDIATLRAALGLPDA